MEFKKSLIVAALALGNSLPLSAQTTKIPESCTQLTLEKKDLHENIQKMEAIILEIRRLQAELRKTGKGKSAANIREDIERLEDDLRIGGSQRLLLPLKQIQELRRDCNSAIIAQKGIKK